MELTTDNTAGPTALATLEAKIEELIQLCEWLTNERDEIDQVHKKLLAERDELLAQNKKSRQRIDMMVARLRGLEYSND